MGLAGVVVLAAVGVAAARAGDNGSAAGECRLDGVPVPGFAQTDWRPRDSRSCTGP
jgi:hypothetical protein